ncbi:TonB-dependent receptor [Duganella vulcania]|nr:TonB-dependent receptor [Duganella vulcania]
MNAFESQLSKQTPLTARRTLLSMTLALAYGMAAGAPAQDGAAADQPAAQPLVQEPQVVTVSANRRREPAREVPMQVNTLSVLQLEQSGAKTLADYLGDQPGVDVKNGGGSGFGSVTLRGVSTGDEVIATVGTYIDDVAYGSSTPFALGSVGALDMGLLDLHHIELLRGPQGTLYGAGAMGGLLKYVTNEPNTSEFSGKLTLGASATRNGKASNTESGVVNIPLKEDVAAMRISAFRDSVGGYIDAAGALPGADINDGTTTGGRVSVLLEPSSRFKLRLTATAQNTKRDSTDYVDYDAASGRPSDAELTRRGALREPYELRVVIAGADLEYDLGWARLNSITSHQHNRTTLQLDYTGIYAPLLSGAGLDLSAVPVHQWTEVRKWTQEFRLTSPAKGRFEWLAGLYYDHQNGSNRQRVDSTLTGGAAGPNLVTADIPSQYRETAAYGDLTWNATPRLAVTGGLRIARNEQQYRQAASGLLLGDGTDLGADSAETSKTYLATVRYALTPASNVYLRAASGYRPGGPNAVVTDFQTGQAAAPQTFSHDSLWSYEAGYKADLLDKTLAVEASVYDIRWDKIQQFFAVNGINVIVNGGKAHINGAELAVKYRPRAPWSVNASLAYVDARLSEDAPGLGADGARLPNSARLSASVGARYNFAVGNRAAYVGLSERYVGERNAGFDANATLPNYKLPAYALTNVQAGIDFGQVQLAMFLNNAFDRRAQLNAGTAFVGYGAPVNLTNARPRTLGLSLTRAF